jgi:hypothetical protein
LIDQDVATRIHPTQRSPDPFCYLPNATNLIHSHDLYSNTANPFLLLSYNDYKRSPIRCQYKWISTRSAYSTTQRLRLCSVFVCFQKNIKQSCLRTFRGECWIRIHPASECIPHSDNDMRTRTYSRISWCIISSTGSVPYPTCDDLTEHFQV